MGHFDMLKTHEKFSKHTVNVDEKQELEDLVVKKG